MQQLQAHPIHAFLLTPAYRNYLRNAQATRHARQSPLYRELNHDLNLSALIQEKRYKCLFDPRGERVRLAQRVGPVPEEYMLFKLAYRGEPENLFLAWQEELSRGEFERWAALRRRITHEQDHQLILGYIVFQERPKDEDEGFGLG